MQLRGLLVFAIAFTWLSGCSNALYFYETEKISMSLEGRPDSSQPVQGSLGLKQRVAIVVPPNDPDTMAEATSMISSFRFRKVPGEAGRFDIGPVTIQTAFVTGKAARLLDAPHAEQIAQAQVIGVRTVGPDTRESVGKKDSLIKCVEKLDDKDTLEAIARDFPQSISVPIFPGSPSSTRVSITSAIAKLNPSELETVSRLKELEVCK